MFAGTALILAALSLFLWNLNEDRLAGTAAEEILPQVVDEIDVPDLYGTEMTAVEIDGYYYIGYLSIPSLDLELPVMRDWSYPQLKISPCRYYGSARTDDLVIAAHNYARHFGYLKTLSAGDMVYFTGMDGIVSAYKVAEIDIISPAAVSEMTDSGYALTLFTCTYGGASRVTVRCERMEETQ